EVDLAGPGGRRTIALESLYVGYARQDRPITEGEGDGKHYLSLRRGEFVTAVRARNTAGLRSAYDKIRIRRSIEYPVTGVAVALRREHNTLADLRVALTGTNPRPVLLQGTAERCGMQLRLHSSRSRGKSALAVIGGCLAVYAVFAVVFHSLVEPAVKTQAVAPYEPAARTAQPSATAFAVRSEPAPRVTTKQRTSPTITTTPAAPEMTASVRSQASRSNPSLSTPPSIVA